MLSAEPDRSVAPVDAAQLGPGNVVGSRCSARTAVLSSGGPWSRSWRYPRAVQRRATSSPSTTSPEPASSALVREASLTPCPPKPSLSEVAVKRPERTTPRTAVSVPRLCDMTGRRQVTSGVMSGYWIYETWRAHGPEARVHLGSCPHCRDGGGSHGGSRPDNGRWHGPYLRFGEASKAACRLPGEWFSCRVCRPDTN